MSVGWQRTMTRDGAEPLALAADAGVGGAWRAGGKLRFYATAEGAARAHDDFEKGYALSAGARLGAFIDPLPRGRQHAYAQQLGSVHGERSDPGALVLDQQRTPGGDTIVYLNANGILDQCAGRIEQAGGKVLLPKTDIGEPGHILLLLDTEGNQVGLHAER